MNRISLQKLSRQISSGLTPLRSNEEFWNSADIPWVKTEQLGVKNIYDSNEKISKVALEKTGLKLYPVNTLSIAMYGEGRTRGSVSILKSKMTTNQACCNIELDPNKANYEFVYYYLKTQYYQLRNLSSGVRKNLNSNDIKCFEIAIPEEVIDQQRIASVLSSLDTKIELNNRINAQLEAMAKTLYDYWFVQFDFPISAEQADAMGQPELKGKPYKSSGGKMVWNKELKREIPAGWEVKKLKYYLKHNYNSISKSKSFDQIEYLDTSSLTNNYISSLQKFNCQTDKIPSRAQRIVSKNDILYSTVRPNQCHYGIMKGPTGNMIASTGFAQLSSKEQGVSNDLIYTFITSHWVTCRLQQIAELSVSAYPSISPTDILELRVALPKDKSINLLKSINKQLDNFYMLISNNQKQNQQLASLRDWLLPMLMNGQVKVGAASSKTYAADEGMDVAAEPGGEYGK